MKMNENYTNTNYLTKTKNIYKLPWGCVDDIVGDILGR